MVYDYRKDWENPVTVEVNLNEYIQRKSDGKPNTNWENKPITMLTKVAKAQALREAFIEELDGMYEAEETGIDLANIPDTPQEQTTYEEAKEAEIANEDDTVEKNPFEEE